ncbi:hypothetical protein BLA24_17620 [Streptomyces cinnamoneus]|uniref:DUF3159 domain-containing protein n=1 Tax=Streptomyces cinnamoneus TaxID=53446 RepID=A0A2G1XHB3_STRCJ|nr:hypothetical protein [Streptomyces cinnamoneus]PHQ50617.1 hypothetical protein BLA24_17620 [Streptomyces cinnamoneus]PPT14128.1 hypothetical protein CYQ11_15655 [Streptomyces cinnamoneus]
MNYLRGFIPWIAFAIVPSADWQWGAVLGLAVGIALLAKDQKAGVAAESLILERSTVVYFAVLTAVAFAVPHSPLSHYSGALSLGWLAVTAWATLAVGRPFTTGIAKRQAPPEVWNTPVFRRINVVITAVWAAAFTLTAATLSAVYAAGLDSTVSIPVQVVGFALPAMFTARYPDRVRARLQQTAR